MLRGVGTFTIPLTPETSVEILRAVKRERVMLDYLAHDLFASALMSTSRILDQFGRPLTASATSEASAS